MAAREGFITRSLRRIKKALDEPSVNAKYSDSEYIEYLEGACSHILGEINRNTQHPFSTFYEVTLLGSTVDRIYTLPPNVGHILYIKLLDTNGDPCGLVNPPGIQNPYECNMELHGHVLRIPKETYTENYRLRFVYAPWSVPLLHYGTAADSNHTSTPTTIKLAATPTAGSLDTRPNAYATCIVRILGSDANDEAQERVVKSYNPATRIATLWAAWSPVPTTNTVYEIAPPLDSVMDMAASLQAAKLIAAIEGQWKRRRAIREELTEMLRDIRLAKANYDAYTGIHFDEEAAYTVGG